MSPSARIIRWLPALAAVMGVLIVLSTLAHRATDREYDLDRFARLPVSADGRVKPMDTVARNTLMSLSGRQTLHVNGRREPAIRFLLDVMARPDDLREYEIVRIDHPDVLALIGRAPGEARRFSLADLEPHWPRLIEQATRALEVEPRGRDPFQRAVVELYSRLDRLVAISQMQSPYMIPPVEAGQEWEPFHEAFMASRSPAAGASHPAVGHVVAIMTAWHEHDPAAFNAATAEYAQLMEQALPREARRAKFEVFFNRLAPFYGATLVYLAAFLLACGSLLARMRSSGGMGGGWAEAARRSSVALLWVAVVVHTLGIAARIYLQGRPPVTNLYSSAVFVGWGCVLLGLLLERLFPLVMSALAAAAIGFATLIIAHNLGSDGDTLQMMQAVLDSNFWLATHVTTIALGYSATFFAGFLGLLYILLGVFTRRLTPEAAKGLSRMTYGVVCFALLLSFVGTVLGGIWADQSWGRFWGWDPKENGAALVVLMNAIILHARWGGMIRERGIAVLAVAGNVVTAWSWFGTNMLGVGLHSYGFMDSAVFWLMAFVVSQFLVMALGLLPVQAWRSYGVAGAGAGDA